MKYQKKNFLQRQKHPPRTFCSLVGNFRRPFRKEKRRKKGGKGKGTKGREGEKNGEKKAKEKNRNKALGLFLHRKL